VADMDIIDRGASVVDEPLQSHDSNGDAGQPSDAPVPPASAVLSFPQLQRQRACRVRYLHGGEGTFDR